MAPAPAPPAGAAPRRAAPVAFGLAAALVAASALLVLGHLHRLQQGDSLLPVLVSLQRWTPWYWDQERFGMLVPLLALPVRHPLGNLLLQHGLMAFAGLAAVVLLARHVLAGRDWPLAGALAAALLLLLAPAPWRFEYLVSQPYGLSLALALAGLAVAEPGPGGRRAPARLAGGLSLVLLAHWVNAATGVVLGALALARAAEDLVEGAPREAVQARLLVDAGLLAAGLAAGQLLLRLYPHLTGSPLRLPTGLLPPAAWPGAWAAIAGRAWADGGGWLRALAAAAALGTALLSLPALRPARRAALARSAALVGAAAAYAAFAGALQWVADNHFHWRYLLPSAVLLHLAACALLAEPLARSARLAGPALGAALLALPLAAIAAGGPPSLAGVRADLDRVAGGHTAALRAAGCDVLAGDYWTVWPAVWHAALVASEEAPGWTLHGVSHRAGPTLRAWSARRAEARICVVPGEEAAASRWLRDYGLGEAHRVGEAAGLELWSLGPAPPGR